MVSYAEVLIIVKSRPAFFIRMSFASLFFFYYLFDDIALTP